MQKLHIANVQFEMLFENTHIHRLEDSFLIHPNLLQMQHLPKIYTEEPYWTIEKPVPLEPCMIEPWGHHPLVKKWAQTHGHSYPDVNMDLMKSISSKRFTFEHCPKLPHAKLITHVDDLNFEGYPIVLKTEFGFSGRGHKIYHRPINNDPFVLNELKKNRVLIAEPWVKRLLDFSTQYLVLDREIVKLGSTIIENTNEGQYRATLTGYDDLLKQYHEHFIESEKLLKTLQSLGFRGNIGIDAFVWEKGVHPICEINPRKTMSFAALQYSQGKKMKFSWEKHRDSSTNLLPNHLDYKNKVYTFPFNFYVSFL